ncbi:MAG: hypothetical protein H6713_02785 [Myxococcales bacterium]|nr:hypothetical protein [Myxococcales bacterium]MCB9748913.1 hypothetical protein [Myxococcales bacterium]
MSSDGFWERYDQKVIEVQALRARVQALESTIEDLTGDRDRWVQTCNGLKQKLASVRSLAEKLAETPTRNVVMQLEQDLVRARGVIGLILIALSDAWVEKELAWKVSSRGGGKLLGSITGGLLEVVPSDGFVSREWIQKLNLDELRNELTPADMPESDSNLRLDEDEDVEINLDPEAHHQTETGRYETAEIRPFQASRVTIVGKPSFPKDEAEIDEIDVDLEEPRATGSSPLPPPPPSSALNISVPPPPLISTPSE